MIEVARDASDVAECARVKGNGSRFLRLAGPVTLGVSMCGVRSTRLVVVVYVHQMVVM